MGDEYLLRISYGDLRAATADLSASQGCGGVAASMAAYAAWLASHSWLFVIFAIVAIYKWLTWGKEAAYVKALDEYEACSARIFASTLDDE